MNIQIAEMGKGSAIPDLDGIDLLIVQDADDAARAQQAAADAGTQIAIAPDGGDYLRTVIVKALDRPQPAA